MKKHIISLFVIVLLTLMIPSKQSISQTIYHSIKVSNIDFNKGQQDTLVYIFVEHEFLKKQYDLHKKQLIELESLVDKYRLQNGEYVDKFTKLQVNNIKLQSNNIALQKNLDNAIDKLHSTYLIGGLSVAVLIALVILK